MLEQLSGMQQPPKVRQTPAASQQGSVHQLAGDQVWGSGTAWLLEPRRRATPAAYGA